MKIIGVLINIPLAGIIVFADAFFALWQPSQNALLIHALDKVKYFSHN